MLLIHPGDGSIVDANQSAENFYGYSRSELLSRNVQDFYTLPQEEVASLREKALEEQNNAFIARHVMKNGELRDVEVKTSPVPVGDETYLFSIVQDVTELKQAKKELSTEKERFEMLMRNASDAIFIMDDQANLIDYSDRTRQLLGYTEEEMKTLKIYDWDVMLNEEQVDQVLQTVLNLELDDFIAVETKHRRKDGTVYDVSMTAKPIELHGKRYAYAAVRDITELKALQQTLDEERLLFKSIFDSAGAVIATIQPDGTMDRINRYGEELTGYSEEEIASKPYFWWEHFIPNELKPDIQSIIESIDNGLIAKKENAWIGKDGQEHIIEWSNTLIHNPDGTPAYLTTVGIDITEKSIAQREADRLNRELKKLNSELEERIKAAVEENTQQQAMLVEQHRLAQLGEMISMIAHQWRQPLSSINSLTSLLMIKSMENMLSEEELIKELEGIDKQVSYLSETIDNFRNFYKTQQNIECFSFQQLFDDLIGIVGTALQNKHITLTTEVKTENRICTYKRQLIQVLLSVINNARDAFETVEKKRRHINISLEEDDDNFILSVSDNASGIPKEILANIFDPYFSTKDEKNGTGLGLYMCKMIMNKHIGGNIVAKNTHEGASFDIIIPRKGEQDIES